MPLSLNRIARARGLAAGFWRAFADHAGARLRTVVLLVAAGAVLEGIGLALLVPILHRLVGSAAIGLPQLSWLIGLMVLASALRAAVAYARDVRLNALEIDFAEAQRRRVMEVLARARWNRIAGADHARITSLMNGDVQRIQTGTQQLLQCLSAVLLLAVQLALAVVLAPALTAATVLAMVLGMAVLVAGQAHLVEEGVRVSNAHRALSASTTGFLGGLKAAAAQEARGSFVTEFSAVQDQIRTTQTGYAARQLARRGWFGISATAFAGGVILIGTGMFGVAPAVLIATLLIFARMTGPVRQLFSGTQMFLYTLPSFDAVDVFERELTGDTEPSASPAPPPPGTIELRGVTYHHAGGGGMSAASLEIAPGSFVGLIGPSGHGKTTLVDIVAGLLEPQVGTMLVGGAVLDIAGRSGWRRQIAYVPQESFLFNDSVRRNLSWGNDDFAAGEPEHALEIAGAAPLIKALGGLDAQIGERGALLSGGERQRLSIARALLRHPRLLLLDEATNALDLESEEALLDRLADMAKRPAILLVSHRTASMRRCDQLFRIEQGTITPC